MPAGEKLILPIHGSDHCPGGPDPIPCLGIEYAFFRAVWTDTVDDLSGTTRSIDWGPLEFDGGASTPGWEIGGNASGVFELVDTGGSGTIADTDRIRWINVNRAGIVTITWGFESTLTGDAANGDAYSMFTELGDPVYGYVHQTVHAAPSGVEKTGYLVSTLQRVLPLLDPFETGPQSIELRTLLSWSGPTSGEDVLDGFIDITWLGIAAPASGEISG